MTAADAQLRDLLGALADLLEQEYGALRAADAQAVADIALRKRELTDALTGTPLPPELGTLAQRCHDLNRRNGELLHLQQGMIARALRVLSGSDNTPTLYSARGQATASVSGRHISSA